MHPSPTTGNLACLLKTAEFVQSLYLPLLGVLTSVTLIDSRQFPLRKVSHTSHTLQIQQSLVKHSPTTAPPNHCIVYFVASLAKPTL